MSAYETVAEEILDQPSLEAARRLIEQRLVTGQHQPELLYALRNLSQDVRDGWYVLLAAARMAPLPLAVSLHTHGRALNGEGDYSAARESLTIAYYAYQWAGDDDGAARAGSTLAYGLYIDSEYDLALGIAEDAAREFQRNNCYFEAGKPLLTITNIYADRQLAQKALGILDQIEELTRRGYEALASTRHGLLDLNLADTWINRGRIAEELMDDFDWAATAYARAETIFSQGRIKAPNYFHLSLNRAIMALRLGHYTEATTELHQAEAYVAPESIPDRIDLALYRLQEAVMLGDEPNGRHWWRTIAELQMSEHKPTRRSRRQQAQAIVVAATLPAVMTVSGFPERNTLNVLHVLSESIQTFRDQNMPLEAALAFRQQARIAYEADLYSQARDYLASAENSLQELPSVGLRRLELLMVQALYDPDCSLDQMLEVARQLRQQGDATSAAAVWIAVGQRYEKLGHSSVEQAIKAYRTAIAAIDSVKGGLRLSTQHVQFLRSRRLPYERLFALLVEASPAEALEINEQSRAQTLLTELLNGGLHQLLARPDEASHHLQALRQQLERAQARIALLRPPHRNLSAGYESNSQQAERQAAEHAYMAALHKLYLEGHETAQWLQGTVAELGDIQRTIDGRTALVWYMVVGSGTPGAELWGCLLLRQGGPHIVRLTRRSRSAQSTGALQRFLDEWSEVWEQQLMIQRVESSGAAQPPQSPFDTALRTMFNLFIQPLESLLATLPDVDKLVFIPDETLPMVPLHAACDSAGTYLVERYTVSYAPSATVLLHCHRREQQRPTSRRVLLAGWSKGPDSAPLQHIRTELKSLEPILHTRSFCDQLSIQQVLTSMHDADIVHLACHGRFPQHSHPRFAHLVCGAEKLYAHDVYGHAIGAALVVFSACDIGQHGAGLQGLVSAGLVAGASALVASMWPAQDKSTALLMQMFYANLMQPGVERATALRQAQRVLLASEHSHPGLWAPFFLTGLPGALPVPIPLQ